MNAFKAGHMNSRLLRSIPLSHSLSQCHWLQTVDVQGRSWCCTPAVTQRRARCPPHVSVPLNRRFTGGTRSHGARRFAPLRYPAFRALSARDYVTKCQTRSASPRRAHDQPFRRLRVLALGHGALWPSCHSKPSAVPYSARLTASDTQVASAAANGGYWPFAARFSVGHGATLRSTLCA